MTTSTRTIRTMTTTIRTTSEGRGGGEVVHGQIRVHRRPRALQGPADPCQFAMIFHNHHHYHNHNHYHYTPPWGRTETLAWAGVGSRNPRYAPQQLPRLRRIRGLRV